ncbi:MAG: hypothetical protein WCE52_18130, partial [Candidatus Acidiferrum sp.]
HDEHKRQIFLGSRPKILHTLSGEFTSRTKKPRCAGYKNRVAGSLLLTCPKEAALPARVRKPLKINRLINLKQATFRFIEL